MEQVDSFGQNVLHIGLGLINEMDDMKGLGAVKSKEIM